MSRILHLGVVDINYSEVSSPKAKKAPKPTKSGKPRKLKARKNPKSEVGAKAMTTGDVAAILEQKYHIMEIFAHEEKDTIERAIGEAYGDMIDASLRGHPIPPDLFAGACSTIDTKFKTFLDQGAMEKLGYPGVPTAAALAGVNHRLKHPYAKANPARRSFVDTGLYRSSFKSWMDKG